MSRITTIVVTCGCGEMIEFEAAGHLAAGAVDDWLRENGWDPWEDKCPACEVARQAKVMRSEANGE